MMGARPAFLLVSAAAAIAPAACRRADEPAPGVPGPMASALLAFAAEQDTPPQEVARAWTEVEKIAAQVSRQGGSTPQDRLARLNAVIFDQLGFTREIEHVEPSSLLLAGVVFGKKGGCVGLGALYLALGEKLGLPLAGVLVPGHFFVRLAGDPPRNVELLRRGEAMSDDWYRTKYGPWDAAASAYQRPLTIEEVIAVHWFNVGNQFRAVGELTDAVSAYRRATRDFPAFAEAAANIGALEQLSGYLSGAENSYRDAARARSDLPGLAHNLSLLQAERESTSRLSASPGPRLRNQKHHGGPVPRRSMP